MTGITYGFELEYVCDHRALADQFARRWPPVGGRGFQTRYGFATITNDVSIRARTAAMNTEIRSPVYDDLGAACDGFQEFSAALRDARGRINNRCGLHLHVRIPWLDCGGPCSQSADDPAARPAADRGQALMMAVLTRWLGVQQDFWQLAYPNGRNIARVCYAVPWTERSIRAIAGCPDHWWHPANRYHDLNVCSLVKHGTLECRLFPATLDGDQFMKWYSNFSDFCRKLELDDLRSLAGAFEEGINLSRTAFQAYLQDFRRRLSNCGN